MTRWDVARVILRCWRCPATIIEGEQYRLYTTQNRPVCIACAKQCTDEEPPADMPMQPSRVLKPPPVWREPNEPLLMSTKERRLRSRQERAGW